MKKKSLQQISEFIDKKSKRTIIRIPKNRRDNEGQSSPEKIFFETHKRVYFHCW